MSNSHTDKANMWPKAITEPTCTMCRVKKIKAATKSWRQVFISLY